MDRYPTQAAAAPVLRAICRPQTATVTNFSSTRSARTSVLYSVGPPSQSRCSMPSCVLSVRIAAGRSTRLPSPAAITVTCGCVSGTKPQKRLRRVMTTTLLRSVEHLAAASDQPTGDEEFRCRPLPSFSRSRSNSVPPRKHVPRLPGTHAHFFAQGDFIPISTRRQRRRAKVITSGRRSTAQSPPEACLPSGLTMPSTIARSWCKSMGDLWAVGKSSSPYPANEASATGLDSARSNNTSAQVGRGVVHEQ